jgi:hypothetical protein
MLHPDVLMQGARDSDGFEDGTAMLCGTLAGPGRDQVVRILSDGTA